MSFLPGLSSAWKELWELEMSDGAKSRVSASPYRHVLLLARRS